MEVPKTTNKENDETKPSGKDHRKHAPDLQREKKSRVIG